MTFILQGATLSWTQELTATLHIVINTIKVTLGVERVRILDVPCGDMAWMSKYLLYLSEWTYSLKSTETYLEYPRLSNFQNGLQWSIYIED